MDRLLLLAGYQKEKKKQIVQEQQKLHNVKKKKRKQESRRELIQLGCSTVLYTNLEGGQPNDHPFVVFVSSMQDAAAQQLQHALLGIEIPSQPLTCA